MALRDFSRYLEFWNVSTINRLKGLIPPYLYPKRLTVLKYLVLGMAIRLMVMPITALPHDAIGNFFIAYVTEHYGMYNFFLHYFSSSPPLLNYIMALFFKTYEIFSPSFFFGKYIIPSSSGYPILFETFPNENYPYYENLMRDPQIFSLLFFGKLPLLIFDIAVGFILLWAFKDSRKSILAFKMWMLNPVSLYTIFMFGELEIIPVFFAVLGTYFIYEKKWGWGFFWLGISIALKPIAFLLLPFALAAAKSVGSARRISEFLVISLLPFVVQSSLAFVSVLSQGVRIVTNVDIHQMYPLAFSIWTRTLLEYSFHATTFEGFIDVIYVFPLAYTILLMFSVFSSRIDQNHIWAVSTALFSLLFAFNLFHPHWFLWFAAFFVVSAVQNGRKLLLYVFYLTSLLLVAYCFYWASLQLALFMPIWPTIYQFPGGLRALELSGLPGLYLVNLARSVLSGVLLFLAAFFLITICLGDVVSSRILRNTILKPVRE